MVRSDTVSFVDVPSYNDSKKAFCRMCEEFDGQFRKLVPRFNNGIRDDKFKICPYCGEMYPIFDVKYFTEYEPKGFISDNPFDSGSKVGIKSTRRKVRKQHRNQPLINEDIEIPKFAGKRDDLLEKKVMEEGAIINSIVDTFVEEEQ